MCAIFPFWEEFPEMEGKSDFPGKMAEKAHPDAPGPKTPIIPKEYQ